MTRTTIQQLLEKYWNCETSPEEEQIIAGYFSSAPIPKEWEKYRILFAWKHSQASIKAPAKLKTPPSRQPFAARFSAIVKIAASVLLIITAGVGFYTHYQQVQWMDHTFSETYSNPQDALKDTKKAIGKVSAVLDMMQKQIPAGKTDSIINIAK
jgi:hypothetical protein